MFTLILSHIFTLNVLQAQVKELPNLSKAKKISHAELKEKTSLISSGTHLPIVNACEVGSYEITIYFEKDSVIYEVISVQLQCINKGHFSTFPKSEQDRLSSGIDAMGEGHWYIMARIGCGKLFEYYVNKFGAVGVEYEYNCN